MAEEITPQCSQCEHLKGPDYWRCQMGRFDQPMARSYFAWSEIKRPNKTVARAQTDCPFFIKKEVMERNEVSSTSTIGSRFP